MSRVAIPEQGAIVAVPGHGRNADTTPCGASTQHETVGCELVAEVIRSTGNVRLRVTGSSMLPTVWPGDVLSIRSIDPRQAQPGDVVLYSRAGRLFAHRVVEVGEQGAGIKCQVSGQSQLTGPDSHSPSNTCRVFVTRGDSVDHDDPAISAGEILGRVTAIERGSRRFAPHRSVVSRMASWVFARSEFATRVAVGIRRRVLAGRVRA